ncbi:hypothetical protein P3X46_022788 [Hevea brasiliensis]|uniref:Auxin-responsive protein n=1 Tax=Hevea brasiliensis TaxID=3981 RepID=A0ABQ9LCB3_HEVBR|nr:auxin-responsive protein IAA31 [Hevea brasiliensis]KAJ9163075.1 hypothetical protein P3X46_022788 [Hevea brasiliensis]
MMELQLGLALPTDTIKGLDLNSYVFDPNKDAARSSRQLIIMNQGMVHPWLSTGTNSAAAAAEDDDFISNHQKRSFYDAFEEIYDMPRTLPLLLWSKQPNEEEDDERNKDHEKSFPSASNKVDGAGDGIVGWPPIKFQRRKISHRSRKSRMENDRRVDNGCADCHGRPSNSMYVKVKMEGVAIGRKIDLSLYNSFQALKHTLLGMFGICQENSSSHKLTFQDSEGDWLLADDVPWRSFIWSVQRLKLIRSSR